MSETDTNKQNDTRDLPAEPAGAVREASEIPKFDLAEQIMAEQRKITAIRRKAPGKPQRLPSLAPPLLSATGDKGVTRVQAQDEVAGKKTEPANQQSQAESIGYTIQQPPLTLSEQGQIIAEIVARDIEKLRRGDTSSLRRPDFQGTNIHPE
ncbi:MAG TPA: hypothetical protein VMW72_21165 [Sedimentisphaerales bacterium]|nr:hypothetical protein [Sedimentisphaerales bacterium]